MHFNDVCSHLQRKCLSNSFLNETRTNPLVDLVLKALKPTGSKPDTLYQEASIVGKKLDRFETTKQSSCLLWEQFLFHS